MNILFVHQHFRHPLEGGAVRSYYLARSLIKNGHHSVVISIKKGISNPSIEEIDGIEVHYLPVDYENKMSFTRRIWAYFSFVLNAISYTSRLKMKDFNLCYCISTPLTSGIIGIWIKWKYKLPFIFEVGDLWPDAPMALGAMKYPFSQKLAKWLEKWIYKNAKGIVGLSPVIASRIKSRTSTLVFYVPNFADTEFFTPKIKKSSSFTICYTGALGRANGLDYLLDCAAVCQDKSLDVKFKIMGEGAVYNGLRARVRRMGLRNIDFLSFGNKEEVKELLNNSDAAYISYKKLEILETGSPNKFFDALAAGKMIIMNFKGWLKQYVDENDCGFSYDPECPDEFTQKLLLYMNDSQKLLDAKKNARLLAENEFALKDWEGEFSKIIAEI